MSTTQERWSDTNIIVMRNVVTSGIVRAVTVNTAKETAVLKLSTPWQEELLEVLIFRRTEASLYERVHKAHSEWFGRSVVVRGDLNQCNYAGNTRLQIIARNMLDA